MSQTISNDYVSMINKSGSGYNIPEIVDAIVDAAIVPVKEVVTAQKEKVETSISGMGYSEIKHVSDADARKFDELSFPV